MNSEHELYVQEAYVITFFALFYYKHGFKYERKMTSMEIVYEGIERYKLLYWKNFHLNK